MRLIIDIGNKLIFSQVVSFLFGNLAFF